MTPTEPTILLLPVITLVLGYVGRMLTEFLTDKRKRDREREARRNDFQRETLVAVQDALNELARLTGSVHIEQSVPRGSRQPPDRTDIPEELSERHNVAELQLLTLGSRVLDDDLRDLISAAIIAGRKAISAADREEGRRLIMDFYIASGTANDRVGQAIRALY